MGVQKNMVPEMAELFKHYKNGLPTVDEAIRNPDGLVEAIQHAVGVLNKAGLAYEHHGWNMRSDIPWRELEIKRGVIVATADPKTVYAKNAIPFKTKTHSYSCLTVNPLRKPDGVPTVPWVYFD